MALMPRVFICYRRDDSAPYAGRLYDQLIARFGAQHVFMDVDTVAPGEDFIEAIHRTMASIDALIVVIGPRWMGRDKKGRSRLLADDDLVRREISTALKRNVRIIPVLVSGAKMPAGHELPADLTPLVSRNAIGLTDARFRSEVDRLIESLERPDGTTTFQVRAALANLARNRTFALTGLLILSLAYVAALKPWGSRTTVDDLTDGRQADSLSNQRTVPAAGPTTGESVGQAGNRRPDSAPPTRDMVQPASQKTVPAEKAEPTDWPVVYSEAFDNLAASAVFPDSTNRGPWGSATRRVVDGAYTWTGDFIKGWVVLYLPRGVSSANDLYVAADVKMDLTKGCCISAGLIFRGSDYDGYEWRLGRDREGTAYYRLALELPSRREDLIAWTPMQGIQLSSNNRLAVKAVGSTITYYLNGHKLGSVESSTRLFGAVGFVAEGDSATTVKVAFDNFIVRRPP